MEEQVLKADSAGDNIPHFPPPTSIPLTLTGVTVFTQKNICHRLLNEEMDKAEKMEKAKSCTRKMEAA